MTAPHPAVIAARTFLDAIIWGEHSKVWDLLSPDGRNRVLVAGSRGGLDAVLAERIRQGTADSSEMDDFLSGLVRGLRYDLSAADLEQIDVAGHTEAVGDGNVRILLEAPAPFHQAAWSLGSIDLSNPEGEWLVDKLAPRLTRT